MSNKACYTFVYYPEHGDPEQICWQLNAMQWNWHLSPLHDKDVNEDGSPKKPHYHFLVGFSKAAPDFATFRKAVKALSAGVLCSPKAKECLCADPEASEDYQSHIGFDDKAAYDPDDCQYSEGWNVQDYASKEQRAEHKRKTRAKCKTALLEYKQNALALFFDWLSADENPCEISALMDYIRVEKPEYFGALLENLYAVKAYADSKRYSKQDRLQSKIDALELQLEEYDKRFGDVMQASYELSMREKLARRNAI